MSAVDDFAALALISAFLDISFRQDYSETALAKNECRD